MVTEIVNVLVDIVKRMNGIMPVDEVINQINKDKKYEKNVVAAAYSWIYEKLLREILQEREGNTVVGFRILSAEEISEIGLENYNYLLHFKNLGLLNSSDMNYIVDRLKLFSVQEISTDQINLLILSLFLDVEGIALPGSRVMLYSSDTIN